MKYGLLIIQTSRYSYSEATDSLAKKKLMIYAVPLTSFSIFVVVKSILNEI